MSETTTKKPAHAGADKPTADAGLADLDVLLKGLTSQPGVEGVLIYNDLGIPLKWTPSVFSKGTSSSGAASAASGTAIPPAVTQMTAEMSDLVKSSRKVAAKLLGGDADQIQMLRLRTTASELIVTPAPDASCTLVTVQRTRSQLGSAGGGGDR